MLVIDVLKKIGQLLNINELDQHIFFLIFQVDLPNHTVSRRSVRDLSHKQTVEKVNRLTEFVLSQIDTFKDKYE